MILKFLLKISVLIFKILVDHHNIIMQLVNTSERYSLFQFLEELLFVLVIEITVGWLVDDGVHE